MWENVTEPKMGMNCPAAPRTLPGGASEQKVKLWCFLQVMPWDVAGIFLCEFGLVD